MAHVYWSSIAGGNDLLVVATGRDTVSVGLLDVGTRGGHVLSLRFGVLQKNKARGKNRRALRQAVDTFARDIRAVDIEEE